MRTHDTSNSLNGYSLIEVLIAFVVLSLGISSIVSFQGRLTHDSGYAKLRTEAANLGQVKLEEFRNYKNLAAFDAITTGTDTIGPAGANVVVANLTTTFTRSWTITNGTNNKAVVIEVSWPDTHGGLTQYSRIKLNTVIARVDPTQTVLSLKTTTTTGASTTTSTAAAATTTSAAATTTTRASATTTTALGSTTTTAAATTSTSTSTSTTSTVTATTSTTVTCQCKRTGNSGNYSAITPSGSCSNACCSSYTPKCSGHGCTFTAFCPL